MRPLLAALVSCSLAHAVGPDRPNIVIIFADDHGARAIGVYGDPAYADSAAELKADLEYDEMTRPKRN